MTKKIKLLVYNFIGDIMLKKRIKKNITKRIRTMFIIFLGIISFFISYNVLMNIKLTSSNEEFLLNMMKDANYYTKYENSNFLSKVMNYIYAIDITKPVSILESSFNYINQFDEEYNPEELEETSKHITDPNPVDINNPIVYIYNSHQLENYNISNY